MAIIKLMQKFAGVLPRPERPHMKKPSWIERRRKQREIHIPRGKAQVSDESGQMTVELCVVFPVVLVIAIVAVNALAFFSECSAFDRMSRNTVRLVATAPAHEQSIDQSISQVKTALESEFSDNNLEVSVGAHNSAEGFTTYKTTLRFYPTLFGMGLKREVFGVQLPSLSHQSTLTISPYKPGMLL